MKKFSFVLLFTLISCGRGPRGHQGAQGPKGDSGADGSSSILSVINPCGEEGDYEEVLLKLDDGRIIALYDGGPHWDRLVVLPYPATYTTSDGFSCSFSLNNAGELE